MSRLVLIAASDDFLLEESLGEAIAEARAALEGAETERLPEDVTPEAVALELRSPSLFATSRVLVVDDVCTWAGGEPPPEAPKGRPRPDPRPLVETLAAGLPDDVALVLGAWSARRPKGKLVDAIERHGRFLWIGLPKPPAPWEDVALSREQEAVVRPLLERALEGARLTAGAESLLYARLGFAPRLLVQEGRKLANAAGKGGMVDEAMVRRLVFPRDRSLEVVQDAVLEHRPAPLLEIVEAAQAGAPVRNWRGQVIEPKRVVSTFYGQVYDLFSRLLYLQLLAERCGIADEMAPSRTSRPYWYSRHFKGELAPTLTRALLDDAPSPLVRAETAPKPFVLGRLFAGAGRYRRSSLVAALAAAGEAETRLRGKLGYEALSVWLTRSVGGVA